MFERVHDISSLLPLLNLPSTCKNDWVIYNVILCGFMDTSLTDLKNSMRNGNFHH